MKLELYHSDHSTCSQKVRICLAEKGLDWDSHVLHFSSGDHLTPEYLKLNPNGVVPTLVHNGEPVIESSVIVEYLDEIYPEPSLSPTDPLLRARLRSWMRYMEEVPTPAVRVPSFNKVFRPLRYENATPEDFEARIEKMPLRKAFYRRMGQVDGFSEEEMDNAIAQIRQTCERIDLAVHEIGGPWVLGSQYTLIDVTLTPLIQRMADLGYSHIWKSDFPTVVAWFERIKSRPSFDKAFYANTNVSEKYPQFFAAGEAE
ncbi:MAG: glutathione S-transferase [Alphaproteobacteria bacterium]|nr:glutathione S-transferase [Alphaproteobacteria bacterium]HCP01154.1 glutathione S-transferase family protein [Rhodospirillaceae bacterium]